MQLLAGWSGVPSVAGNFGFPGGNVFRGPQGEFEVSVEF